MKYICKVTYRSDALKPKECLLNHLQYIDSRNYRTLDSLKSRNIFAINALTMTSYRNYIHITNTEHNNILTHGNFILQPIHLRTYTVHDKIVIILRLNIKTF